MIEKITKRHITMGITILIVVAIGMFIVNQFVSFQYKAQLLADPCYVCEEQFGYDCQDLHQQLPGLNINLSNIVINPPNG